ncbi:MAG: mechanosensitive ion channel [Acidobacteriota bacterium]|jgi:small-conductance mechanosensitive channel
MRSTDVIAAGIRFETLLWCIGVAVAAAIIHLLLRWQLARGPARAEAPGADATSAARLRWWLARAVRAVLPTIGLIVWIHAGWAILDLLLAETTLVDDASRLRLAVAWIYRALMLVAAWKLLARIGGVLEEFLRRVAERTGTGWDDVLLPLAGRAIRRLLPFIALILAAPALAVSPALETIFRNGASLALIGMVAFVLFQLVEAVSMLVLREHRLDTRDNLQARAIHTQVMVLRKVAITVIAVFTLASMLMVFDSVRQFGASILASAGIAGIIIGFAAQQSIATLLAGFQIAITQPIRVDDVVIVEGEWGRIEDITLTYVVVRIWDLRRLVVPINYFIEKPFQNWTRRSADILVPVFVHVDYTMPLDELRAELTRVLEASKHWDGKVNVLHVTGAKEHTLEVRALASAVDSGTAWELACEIREKLVGFVQRNHPDALPKLRGRVESRVA